jgi:hypothetical protein
MKISRIVEIENDKQLKDASLRLYCENVASKMIRLMIENNQTEIENLERFFINFEILTAKDSK